MALTNTYAMSPTKIPQLFKKIQEGQAPSKFTQQHLKDIGFKGTNDRPLIKVLKELKFLTSDGIPTERYHNYRDSSKSKKVLGQALKEVYSDLFVINEKPTPSNKSAIEGKFKSTFNCNNDLARRMTTTFFALLSIADISSFEETTTQDPSTDKEIATDQNILEKPSQLKMGSAGFHYNIQVHLPATKDIEVYNSIFKSIKEHLFE